MKILANILFVYIPYVVCVLLQLILIASLYSDETGVAPYAKWGFPLIALAGIVLHFVIRKKK